MGTKHSLRRNRLTTSPRAVALGAIVAGGLAVTTPAVSAQADSTTITAGADYDAGSLHELLLGRKYRDSWTTPIRVPVLELGTFAGGLTPVERGGGVQTRTLRFEGADGREYNFRSVNKTYRHSVPDWARGTLLEWLRQDQTSAQHPGAAIVATPLLDAAGILNPGPRLAVMPDDPRLGEFREEFAGLLGTIELHPNEGEDDEPLFADSRTIAGGDRVLEHLAEEPEHRLDEPAFLAERLMSIYIGDWDRHIGQYRFARYQRDGIYRWVAIPEDRDYAFLHHDGLLLSVARGALTSRLIRFEESYPSLTAMMSNSPGLVRRLLAPVDRPTWDSVAHAVHAALTDEAIDAAVRSMPPEWQALTADELAAKLRARRERFLDMSEGFYEMLAAQPEVHATDAADVAIVDRHADSSVSVRLFAPGNEDLGDRPYFERRFVPSETREVRVFLYDGDDRAVVRGARDGEIVVRVVGGEGDDVLADSAGEAVVFYDAEGDNEIHLAAGTRVDRKPYEQPEERDSLLPNKPRDWGRTQNMFRPELGWEPDVGLLVGGGPSWTRYGFRHDPYTSLQTVRLMVAPGAWRGRVAYYAKLHPENSDRWLEVVGGASNVERLRFHGFGNASPALPDDSVLTWYRRYGAGVAWKAPLSRRTLLSLGGVVEYTDPELDAGTRLAERRPFGAEGLGDGGLRVVLLRDTRDDAGFPRRGLLTSVDVSGRVPFRDSPDPFGKAAAATAGYLTLPVPLSPVLALRAGGESVLGDAPLYHAAFLGGRNTLRGYSNDRFVGDALAHGSAELRVPVLAANFVARGTLGVSAFSDAGRVWAGGETVGEWHTAVGGGLWFNTPLATVAVEYASGEKETIYLRLGMGF